MVVVGDCVWSSYFAIRYVGMSNIVQLYIFIIKFFILKKVL